MRAKALSGRSLTLLLAILGWVGLSTFHAPLHAEEEERGRLADGRAFRTDGEGNQLVDYIAELEVTAEALQTQVQGLESELKEKIAKISVLEGQQGCLKPLAERALTTTPQTADLGRCDTERSRISQLDSLLESAREDLTIERQLSVKRLDEAKRTELSLRSEIEERTKSLESLTGELKLAQGELQNLQKQLSAQPLAVVRAQVIPEARAALKPETIAPEVAIYPVTERSTDSQTVGLANPLPITTSEAQVPGASATALIQARGKAVEVVRARMRTEINQLKGLIASRDQAFRNYNRSATSVSFRPQPVVSESGMSLAEIERRLVASSTVSEVARLGRDIAQIRARMNEDIALLKRMRR